MYAVELSVDLPSLTLLNTALASACIMNWYLSGRVVGSTESSISDETVVSSRYNCFIFNQDASTFSLRVMASC